MYLQAVLEDSRKALNDSSSGLRKLARMVDGLNPQDHNGTVHVLGPEAGVERRGFIKKALGLGKTSRDKSRGGNADTYDLITPFRLDNWGWAYWINIKQSSRDITLTWTLLIRSVSSQPTLIMSVSHLY